MSRAIMQQALDALKAWDSLIKYQYSGTSEAMTAMQYAAWNTLDVIGKLEAAIAQPEQTIVPFPSFMRKRIEEAIDDAINPQGMSVHDGKATVYAADLQRMLLVVDLAAQQLAEPDLSIEANRVAYDVAMHYANKTKEKLG